jgi:hypothetical protein
MRGRLALHRSLSRHLQRPGDATKQLPHPATWYDDRPGEDYPAFRFAFEVAAR